MKVNPVPSASNTVQTSTPQGGRSVEVRTMRMNTQQTPVSTPPPEPQNVSTADTNDTANASAVSQPLSPQQAALARHRRALQVKERELQAREEALKSQQPAQGTTIDVARLKEQPLSVLLENGVTYDQLTQAVLAAQNGVSPAEFYALKQELKALKEGVDTTLTERQAQADKQAMHQMNLEARRLSAEGDEFEMVRVTQSVPAVMQLIERTYKEKGELLDVREALELVENELMADVLKAAASTKVQNKMAPQPVPQGQSARPPTLTNRDGAQVPMTPKQRAIAAFYGQPIKR